MFKLPMTPGESAILLDDTDHNGNGDRIRVECFEHKSGLRWLVHVETVDVVIDATAVDPEDADLPLVDPGGVSIALLSKAVVDLVVALRSVADDMTRQVIEVSAKMSTAAPGRRPVKVVSGRGWWGGIEIVGDADGLTYGLAFKRPLSAEELMVWCRAMAKWIDAQRDHG